MGFLYALVLQDLFFARLPYANKDIGAGPRATRFIALAPADNAGMHAFGQEQVLILVEVNGFQPYCVLVN